MPRHLGIFTPKRPAKLNAPLLAMLLNAVHDRHDGRVFVLQVGAGSGEEGLPLLPRFQADGWSGLLIEPEPRNFARLEALHAESDRIAVLNLGISDIAANLLLHAVSDAAAARLPRLPRNRASLIRDRIALPGLLPEDIVSTEVPFLRLDSVLEELGLDSAQLVVIDAGGHEAQVLQSFSVAALSPSLVLVDATPGTSAEADCIAALHAADLAPFRVGGWLVGLLPGALAVPLDELLTFFQKRIDDTRPDDPSDPE